MTLLVISGQFGIITTVLLLWLVQDLTYAPGWAHPVAYYFAFALLVSAFTGLAGALPAPRRPGVLELFAKGNDGRSDPGSRGAAGR